MPEFLNSCAEWRDEDKQKGMPLAHSDTELNSRAI